MATARTKGRARLSGEYFVHRHLWHAADHLRERGRPDQDGNGYVLMSSMLMLYFAVEAFTNELGPKLRKDAWKDERSFFSTGKYRGTLGKLRLLADELALTYPLGKRPWSTVKELERRRNTVVHARTQVFDKVVKFSDPRKLKAMDPDIYALSEVVFLDRAFSDVEAIGDRIQLAAQQRLGEWRVHSARAFVGILGHQGGEILEMPTVRTPGDRTG